MSVLDTSRAHLREGLEPAVWAALGTVRDPELDEPITELKFVTEASVADGVATVRLRLPTYFCAPNFAYLMVADAHDAVAAVDGVHSVSVRLEDHFASAEINGGVSEQAGFTGSFPGQAAGELDELRLTFQRKAHTACLERASKGLLAKGWMLDDLPTARLADLAELPGPSGPADRDSLLRRRADLGLSVEPDDPLLVDEHGVPVPAEKVKAHLRFAQAVRVSIDGNGTLCRGLLKTRYGDGEEPGTRSGVELGRMS
jgi:metal-sulfur cluster biosynthetic enzyme